MARQRQQTRRVAALLCLVAQRRRSGRVSSAGLHGSSQLVRSTCSCHQALHKIDVVCLKPSPPIYHRPSAHLQPHGRPLGLGHRHNPARHGQPIQRLHAGVGRPCRGCCLGCCRRRCCVCRAHRGRLSCRRLGWRRLGRRRRHRLSWAAARGCVCCSAAEPCLCAEACCLPPRNLHSAQPRRHMSGSGLAAGGGSGGRQWRHPLGRGLEHG